MAKSIKNCIATLKKAGSLTDATAQDVMRRAEAYRAEGYTAEKADAMAVTDALDEQKDELRAVYSQIGFDAANDPVLGEVAKTEAKTPAAKKPTAKQKRKELEDAVFNRMGFRIGDTVTFSTDIDYLSGGTPYVVQSIGENSAYFRNPKIDAGTSSKFSLLAGRREQGRLSWTVEPAQAEVTAEVGATKTANKKPATTNTEDAGAELTYNLRNRRTTGVKWEDLADKEAALRVKEVTKAKVYPKPDYAALSEQMSPLKAHLFKQVYDGIAAAPKVRGTSPTDQELQNYIAEVNRVMSAVTSWMNDSVFVSQYKLKANDKSLLDAVYPDGWRGQKDEIRLLGGNRFLGALQPGYDEVKRAEKALAEGWPAPQEAWQRQGYKVVSRADGVEVKPTNVDKKYYVSIDGSFGKTFPTKEEAQAAVDAMQDWLALNKHGRVIGQFPTQEEALAHVKQEASPEGREGKVSDKGIKVEHARRKGPERRMEGENVTSDQLRETFGFKGVNFGNWMKGGGANANERQLHLNHAYDSFMDLADILGVPPKAMSLNGMLGIAFGAQGRAGAAAHFVPGVNEINLTRESGAGSLGHEFAHALDHYFARLAGMDRETEPFLTEHTSRGATGELRPEIMEKFKAIVEAMNRRPMSPIEWAAQRRASVEKWEKQTDRWIQAIRRGFESATIPKTTQADSVVRREKTLAKFDEIANRIRALDLGDGLISVSTYKAIFPAVAELRELHKETFGRQMSLDESMGLQGNIEALKFAKEAAADDKSHAPQMTKTNYATNAAQLDKDEGKKKPYWNTNLEKFARAFDAYLSDTLAERAALNSYLSHTGRTGMTVPEGDERARINAAFKDLVDTIESKETDRGMAMFSRTDASALETATRRMDKFVSEAEAGRLKSGDTQALGDTPTVLQYLGAPNLPMQIDGGTVMKVIDEKHRHTMNADDLRALPKGLYDPLMVFDSPDAKTGAPGKLIVTERTDRLGNVIVAMVHISKQAGRIVVNDVASTYGLEDFENRPKVSPSKLEYIRNEEALAVSTTPIRRLLVGVVQKARELGLTIATEADVVNQFGSRYSRAGTPIETNGISVDSVEQEAQQLLEGLDNAPPVKVVWSPKQLPFAAPDNTRGVYHHGRVYLVAGAIRSSEELREVVAHETMGHYGLRGFFGTQAALDAALIAIHAKNPSIRLATTQWKRRNPDLIQEYQDSGFKEHDIHTIAIEEAMAEVAQRGKPITGLQRLLSVIQTLLRKVGFDKWANALEARTDAEAMQMLENARLFVKNGKRSAGEAPVTRFVADGNLDFTQPAVKSLADLWRRMADNADVFQYGRTDKKDLSDLFVTLMPKSNPTEKDKYFERPLDPGMRLFEITAANGASASIWINDNDQQTWIDVSKLKGEGAGAEVYNAVANWAYNNDYEFIGDPYSISKAGMKRRLENMISSALKFKTLRHLAANDQMRNWVEETTGRVLNDKNLDNLLRISYDLVRMDAPLIEDIFYNVEANRYEWADTGQEIPPRTLELIAASTRGMAGAGAPGIRTLQRALLSNTYLRGEGKGLALAERSLRGNVLEGLDRKVLMSRKPSEFKAVDTESPAFRKWFGDSKVVDADGKPLRVYHGTGADISAFEAQGERIREGKLGKGIYLTPSPQKGNFFAGLRAKDGAPNVVPIYVSIKNPFEIYGENNRPVSGVSREKLQDAGYDGVIMYGEDGAPTEIVAFSPTQIKSAISNTGGFSDTDSRIMFSRSPQSSMPLNGGANPTPAWSVDPDTRLTKFIYQFQNKYVDLKDAIKAIEADKGAALQDAFNPYQKEELYHKRAASRTDAFMEDELKPLLVQMRMNKVERADFEEYLHARHAKEANALIRDRDGMDDGGSGMTDAEADAYFAALDPKLKATYEKLAAKVDAITSKTRQLLADYGLESNQTVQEWGKMFQHYVPLNREDMEQGTGIGQGFSVRGSASKHRTGSSRKVADILANIANQRDRAIVRGEKNRVAVSLYGLAFTNPNEEMWEAGKVPTTQTLDKNGKIVSQPDPMYKNKPNVLVARIKDKNGNVHDRAVVFNERNERAVRMAEALKNLDAPELGQLMSSMGMVTRYISSINTQYNPVFVFINFLRDLQSSAINLSSTPLAGKQKEVVGNAVSAVAGIYSDLRARRNGNHPTSKWAQLYEQMQKDGGTTGYRDMFGSAAERSADQIDKLVKDKWGRDTKLGRAATGRAVLDLLSDANETAENAMRLAVYKTALDHGLSRDQAASLSKNISVNFNRKGQLGSQMNAAYAFFNAAVQGTDRLQQTLRGPAGKKIVAGGVLLGMAQALAMAAAGFDDDDPPDFVRERNLVIPVGDKKFITIPMPLGFHVLPNMGRIPMELMLRGFKKPGKAVTDFISVFAEAFNPIGNAGLSYQTLAPSIMDPAIALLENRDWTGKPIVRESFDRNEPGHNRAKDTATPFARWMSKTINAASGGTDYVAGSVSPSPDAIDYLVGQATGGVGRELSKAWQTGSATVTGEELPVHKVPLLGRFYGEAKGQSHEAQKFYENLNRLDALSKEIKGRRQDGLDASEIVSQNPEVGLIKMANKAQFKLSQLRREKRRLVESGDKAGVKEVEARITDLMKRVNERVEEVSATQE